MYTTRLPKLKKNLPCQVLMYLNIFVCNSNVIRTQKIRLFPSECPGEFFYRDPAAAKIVNFSKLVNNAMEHLL